MIEIGRVGYVASGEDRGSYVKVQELPDDPPSYLVLVAGDPRFTTPGGDYWVEDHASLVQFFEESRWVVEWQ